MSPNNGVEQNIVVALADEDLLVQALTHSSYIHEHPEATQESNERLEFLGDSVLGFIIADDLYGQWPLLTEGEMTTLRAQLVSTQALASAAEAMELGKHLRLGRGEELSGGRTKPRNLAGALEAIIGAVWLDAGLDAARSFVVQALKARIQTVSDGGGETDYKSRLQELTQARLQVQPRYETTTHLSETGDPIFATKVIIGGRSMGRGDGGFQAGSAAGSRQTSPGPFRRVVGLSRALTLVVGVNLRLHHFGDVTLIIAGESP